MAAHEGSHVRNYQQSTLQSTLKTIDDERFEEMERRLHDLEDRFDRLRQRQREKEQQMLDEQVGRLRKERQFWDLEERVQKIQQQLQLPQIAKPRAVDDEQEQEHRVIEKDAKQAKQKQSVDETDDDETDSIDGEAAFFHNNGNIGSGGESDPHPEDEDNGVDISSNASNVVHNIGTSSKSNGNGTSNGNVGMVSLFRDVASDWVGVRNDGKAKTRNAHVIPLPIHKDNTHRAKSRVAYSKNNDDCQHKIRRSIIKGEFGAVRGLELATDCLLKIVSNGMVFANKSSFV